MEVFDFNYKWSRIRARLTKGGGVYVDLPSRIGYRDSLVLEDRGWRYSSTQDDCIDYYFHVWLKDNGMVSWANDMTRGIQYVRDPFDPDAPNAGLLNDTVLKVYTIAKTIRDYQARKLPIAEAYELRKKYLDTTLKMLGYDSIDAVGEELDESKAYLPLNRVVDCLENYKHLGGFVYSLEKLGDYDMYTQRFKEDITREEVLEYMQSIQEQVDSNIEFMQKHDKDLALKRRIYPDYRDNMSKKTGIYIWDDYKEKVKSVALLLLELNADILTPKQREKLEVPEFEVIDQVCADDKIAKVIDGKAFNDACKVEDEIAYEEAKELVRRAKEIKPEVYPSDPEAITAEDIVSTLESELKEITERKESIEKQDQIYAKYYSKARKKVKVREDEYAR